MPEQKEFTAWLNQEMQRRDWSQADLARHSALSRAVINKLLNAKTHPQPSTLAAISRAFKVPIETAYREAGLLPGSSTQDDYVAEVAHKLSLIKDPHRKATALRLLHVLIEEEASG